MMGHLLMAATLSIAAGTAMWVGDKLGISAVAPPKNSYVVTLDTQITPPPNNPPPRGNGVVTDKGAKDDEVRPEEEVPEHVPREVVPLDLTRAPKPVSTGPSHGETGSGPAGSSKLPGGAGPGCLLPPCIGTFAPKSIVRSPIARPTPPAPVDIRPLASVMARAIYSPDPDPKKFALTRTGRTHRSPGRSTVSFCIGPAGRTQDVRTTRAFSGDRDVDRICREAVKKWRFSPLRVGGKARTSCSKITFDIEFE